MPIVPISHWLVEYNLLFREWWQRLRAMELKMLS
jgi:hypothetical protein